MLLHKQSFLSLFIAFAAQPTFCFCRNVNEKETDDVKEKREGGEEMRAKCEKEKEKDMGERGKRAGTYGNQKEEKEKGKGGENEKCVFKYKSKKRKSHVI